MTIWTIKKKCSRTLIILIKNEIILFFKLNNKTKIKSIMRKYETMMFKKDN